MSSIHDANDIASLTKYLTTTLLICLYNVYENEWFLPKLCIFSQFNSKLMIMIKKIIKLHYATCTLDICYLKLRSYAWLTSGDKKNLNHGLKQKTNPQKTLWIFSNVIMKRLEK